MLQPLQQPFQLLFQSIRSVDCECFLLYNIKKEVSMSKKATLKHRVKELEQANLKVTGELLLITKFIREEIEKQKSKQRSVSSQLILGSYDIFEYLRLCHHILDQADMHNKIVSVKHVTKYLLKNGSISLKLMRLNYLKL